MIRLFVNALAASAGGGLTYVRNVIPRLAEREDSHAVVLLSRPLLDEFSDYRNVTFITREVRTRGVSRLRDEQRLVRNLIGVNDSEILLSAGNFALRKSPIPQIVLSRNSLYTSRDFFHVLWTRREYRMWLDTKIKGVLAKKSVHWADRCVAPSQAFADELKKWTSVPVIAIQHGFDREIFFGDATPLSTDIQEKISLENGALRLLFVSHYNYFRNFETLLRALPLVKKRLAPKKVRLFLTSKLRANENPGLYRTESAAALVMNLGLRDDVVELGAIPYRRLHHLYQACNFYVSAAYAETFAHPMVEAMACGLPVLASDIPVHREICGDAALYFGRFDHVALAEQIIRLAASESAAETLSVAGLLRSQEFSWSKHVDELITLAHQLRTQDGSTPPGLS